MSNYLDRLIEEEYDELEKLKVLEDITWKETFKQGAWQTTLQPMAEGHIPMWAHKIRSQMAPDTDVYKDSPFTLGSSFVLPEDHFEDRKDKLLDFSHQAWERAHELTRDRLNPDSDLFDAEYAAYHLKVANAKILEKGMFDMNVVKKALGMGLPSMGIAWGGGALAGLAGTLAGGPAVGGYAAMGTVAALTGMMEGGSEFSEAVDYNMELGMTYQEATDIASGTAAAYALASAFLEGVLPVARVGRWLFPGIQAKWIKTAFGSMKGKMGAKYTKFGRTWYGKPVNNILAQAGVEALEEFLQYAAQTAIQTTGPLAYKEESFGEVFDWEEALSGAYGGLLLGGGMGAVQTAADYTSVPQRIRDINAEPVLGETNLLIKKNKETGLYELQVWNGENELAHEPDVYNSYKEAGKARDTILTNLEALWEEHQKIQDQGETSVQEDDKKADGAPVTPPDSSDLQRSTQELLMLSFLGKEGDLSTEDKARLENYKIELAGEGKTEIQQIEDLINTAPNILEAMGVTPEEFMQFAEEAGIDVDPAIFEGAGPLITPEAGEVASSDIPGPEGGVVATPEEDVPVVPEVPTSPQVELFPDEPSPEVPEEPGTGIPEFPEPPKVGEELEKEVKEKGGVPDIDTSKYEHYKAKLERGEKLNSKEASEWDMFMEAGLSPAKSRSTTLIGEYREIRKQPTTQEGVNRLKEIIDELEALPPNEFSVEELVDLLAEPETPIRESKIKKPEEKGTIVGRVRKAMGLKEREDKVPVSGEVGLTSILRQMRTKFAADFQTVDEDGTIRDFKGDEIGKLKKGEVRKAGRLVQREDGTWIPRIDFSQARASDAFHEYAHPLLHNLYQENPEEFQRLVDEMMATKWGKKLMQVVYENYSQNYDLDHLFQEEALAHAIGWFASDEYFDKISPEEQGAFVKFITKIFNFIKDQINRMFKVPPLPEFDMVDPTTIKNITIQDIVEWMSNEEISISTHPIWANRGWDMADRMAGLETMSNTSLTGDMSALILYGERVFAHSETRKHTVEAVIKVIEYYRDKVLKIPNPKKKIEKWKIADIKRIEGKIKNLSSAIMNLSPLSDQGTNFVDEAASEIVIKVLEEQDMDAETKLVTKDPDYGVSKTEWLDFFGQLEVLEATYPIVDKLRLMDSDRPIPIHDESLFGGLSKAEKKVFSEFINELTENSTAMFDDTPTNNELHLAAIISLNGTIPYNDAVNHIKDFRAGKQQTLPASLLADLFESWVKTRYGIKHMATDRLSDEGNNVYGINSQTASKYGIKRLGLDPNETDLERVQLLQDFAPHTDTLHGFEGKGTDYKAPRLFIGYSWYTLISRGTIPPLSIESQSNLKPRISSSFRNYLSQKDKVSSTKEGVENALVEDSLERVGISISQQIPLKEVDLNMVIKWIQSEGYTDEEIKSQIHAITHESIDAAEELKGELEIIDNHLFSTNIIISILKSTFGEYNKKKNKYEYEGSKNRREMEKFGRDLNNKILENSTDMNNENVWANPMHVSGQQHKHMFIEEFLSDYNSMDTKHKILGNITEEDVIDALSKIRIPTSNKYLFDEGYATYIRPETPIFEAFIHDTQNFGNLKDFPEKDKKIAGLVSHKYHKAISMAIYHVILTKASVFYGTPKMIAQASLFLQEEGNIPHVFKAEISKGLHFEGMERMFGYNTADSPTVPSELLDSEINGLIRMLFFSGVEFPVDPSFWDGQSVGHPHLMGLWAVKDAKPMLEASRWHKISDYDASERHPFHLTSIMHDRINISVSTRKEMSPDIFDHSDPNEYVPEIKGMPFLETRLKPGQLVETGSKLIYSYRTKYKPGIVLQDQLNIEKIQPAWQTPQRIRNVGMYLNKLYHSERWRRIQTLRFKTEISNKLDRLERWINSLTKGEEASRQWFLDLVSGSKEIHEVNKSYRLDDIAPLMHTMFKTTEEGITFLPESDPNYNDYDKIISHFTGGNVPTHWKQEWLHQFAIAQAAGHSEMYSIGAQLSHVVQGNNQAYPMYATESEALYTNLLNWYKHMTQQPGNDPSTLWGQGLVDGFIHWVDNGKGVKTLKGLDAAYAGEAAPSWIEPKGDNHWFDYIANLQIFKEWAFAVEFGVPIMGVVEKDVSKYIMTSQSNFDRSESPYFDQEIAYSFWGKKKVKKPGGRKGEILEPAREGWMGLSRRKKETRPMGIPKAMEIAARNTALKKLASLGYVQVTEIPARDVPMLREVFGKPYEDPVHPWTGTEEWIAAQQPDEMGMIPVPEQAPLSDVLEMMQYFPAYKIKFLRLPGEAVPRWSKLDINESKEGALDNPTTPENPKRPPLTPDNPEWSKWFNIIESAYKKVSRRADLNHFPIQLRAWLDTVTENIPDYILPVFEKWQAQTHIQNIIADGNLVSDLIGNVRYGSDAKVLSVAEAEDFFNRVSEDFFNELEGELGEEIQVSEGSTFKIRRIAFQALRVTLTATQVAKLIKATQHDVQVFMNEDIAKITHVSEFTEYQARMMFRFWLAHRTQVTVNQGQPGLQEKDNIVWTFDNGKIQLKGEKNPWSLEKTEENYNDVNPSKEREFLISRLYRELKGVIRNKASLVFMQKHDLIALPQWAVEANRVDVQLKSKYDKFSAADIKSLWQTELKAVKLVPVALRGEQGQIIFARVRPYMERGSVAKAKEFWKEHLGVNITVEQANKMMEGTDYARSENMARFEALNEVIPGFMVKTVEGQLVAANLLDVFKRLKIPFTPSVSNPNMPTLNAVIIEASKIRFKFDGKNLKGEINIMGKGLPTKYLADGATFASRDTFRIFVKFLGLSPSTNKVKNVIYQKEANKLLAYKHEVFPMEPGMEIYNDTKLVGTVDEKGNIIDPNGNVIDMVSTDNEAKLIQGYEYGENIEIKGESFGLLTYSDRTKKSATFPLQWLNYMTDPEVTEAIKRELINKESGPIVKRLRQAFRATLKPSNMATLAQKIENAYPDDISSIVIEKFYQGSGINPDNEKYLDRALQSRLVGPAIGMEIGNGYYAHMYPNLRQDLGANEVALAYKDVKTTVIRQYKDATGDDAAAINDVNEWLKDKDIRVLVARSPITYIGGVNYARVARLHTFSGLIEASSEITFKRQEGDHDGDAMQVEFLPESLDELFKEKFDIINAEATAIDIDVHRPFNEKIYDFSVMDDVFNLMAQIVESDRARASIASIQGVYGIMEQVVTTLTIGGLTIRPISRNKVMTWDNISPGFEATPEEMLRLHIQAATDVYNGILLDKWGYNMADLFISLFETVGGIPLRDFKKSGAEEIYGILLQTLVGITNNKSIYGAFRKAQQIKNGGKYTEDWALSQVLKESIWYNEFLINRESRLRMFLQNPEFLDAAEFSGSAVIEDLATLPARMYQKDYQRSYHGNGPAIVAKATAENAHVATMQEWTDYGQKIQMLDDAIQEDIELGLIPSPEVDATVYNEALNLIKLKARRYAKAMGDAWYVLMAEYAHGLPANVDYSEKMMVYVDKFHNTFRDFTRTGKVLSTIMFLESDVGIVTTDGKRPKAANSKPPYSSKEGNPNIIDWKVMKEFNKLWHQYIYEDNSPTFGSEEEFSRERAPEKDASFTDYADNGAIMRSFCR